MNDGTKRTGQVDWVKKTTYRMEMRREDFRPKENDGRLEVVRVGHPYSELAKFLHTLVGQPWRWGGRENWRQAEWDAFMRQPGYEMVIALFDGTPVGYSEMLTEGSGDVQISTMGLAPDFIGKGLGGIFLSQVVRMAWERTKSRVWLSTCSHDHPLARATYEARGFTVFEVRKSGDANPPMPSFWDVFNED